MNELSNPAGLPEGTLIKITSNVIGYPVWLAIGKKGMLNAKIESIDRGLVYSSKEMDQLIKLAPTPKRLKEVADAKRMTSGKLENVVVENVGVGGLPPESVSHGALLDVSW